MTEPSFDILEKLEAKLVPLLTSRGIEVDSIQPIGLIGRGASSTVFSLLINNEYHVLKLYYSHTSFLREQHNRRRLLWPPKVVLASRQSQNSLGYDLVVTKVPPGVSLNSTHMLDWVQDRLGRHLIELHRIRRTRHVTQAYLRSALADTEPGAMKAAHLLGGEAPAMIENLATSAKDWLSANSKLMRVQSSLLHNDLWWANTIVAKDDVYFIDWESMKTGDYAEDLAFARVMLDYVPPYQSQGFWRTARNADLADRFWAGIIDIYRHDFNDETLYLRLRYYLVLQTFRRLSDIAYSQLPPNMELVKTWIEQLPQFWERGLELEP